MNGAERYLVGADFTTHSDRWLYSRELRDRKIFVFLKDGYEVISRDRSGRTRAVTFASARELELAVVYLSLRED